MLLLAVSVPLILRRRQYGLLLPIAFAIIVSPWLQDVPPFSVFFGRLDEFSTPFSSGSMRFFEPYQLINDLLLDHPTALLFGYGPGTSDTMSSLLVRSWRWQFWRDTRWDIGPKYKKPRVKHRFAKLNYLDRRICRSWE